MYCSKCGTEMPDGASFCPKCGESTSPNQVNDDLNTILDSAFFSPTQKVILKPDEQTPKKEVKDSSKTMAGSSKSLGTVLIILGIVCDVISMFMIGSSSFEDFKFITIAGTICFLVGLCLKFFGNFGE